MLSLEKKAPVLKESLVYFSKHLPGQSIGEPGTQLTLRTFHTGGVFTGGTADLGKHLALYKA